MEKPAPAQRKRPGSGRPGRSEQGFEIGFPGGRNSREYRYGESGHNKKISCTPKPWWSRANYEQFQNERLGYKKEANRVAKSLNIEYIETSAKTGKNLEKIFYRIADSLVQLRKKND